MTYMDHVVKKKLGVKGLPGVIRQLAVHGILSLAMHGPGSLGSLNPQFLASEGKLLN